MRGIRSVLLLVLLLVLCAPTLAAAHEVTYIGDPEVDSSFMEKWASPVSGAYTITGKWGEQRSDHTHMGIDIAPNGDAAGAPIFAVADGVVRICTDDLYHAFFGWVVIDHGGGYETWYGDLDGFNGQWGGHPLPLNSPGTRVHKGEVIGYLMGDGTYVVGGAKSTGPHVHFEVRLNGESLPPSYYAGFGDWIAGDPSSFQDQAAGKAFVFNAESFIKFLDPLRKAIDQIAEICVKGQHLVVGIVQWVLITLMTIDFAITAMLSTVDSQQWSGGKNTFIRWFVLKFLLYLFLIYVVTHWAGFVANEARDLFMNSGAAVAGSDLKTVSKAVVDPFGIIATGAKICDPVFKVLTSVDSIVGQGDLIGRIARSLMAIVTIGVVMISFFLIAMQVAFAYIEFYIVMLFSFVNFMFAGLQKTRHLAARGLNGVFSASIKLFFWCFFVMCLQSSLYSIQVNGLTQMNNSMFMTNGSFSSLDQIAYAIGEVESGHRADVYNDGNPRGGRAAYGTYQQMPEFWDGRVEDWNSRNGNMSTEELLAYSLQGDPPNSPHAQYGVTYYGWNPALQEGVSLMMMQDYLNESNGDYRYVATRWLGAMSDEYWAKVCQAGGQRKKVTELNIAVALKLILCCLMFVFIGDRIGQRIMKTFGGGNGFLFTN